MSCFINNLVAILFWVTSIVNAEYKPSLQTRGKMHLNFSEDAMLKFSGGTHFLNQLEQVDEYFFKYSKQGITAKEGSAGIEVEIGKLGNLHISGGGEVLVLSRTMNDTTARHPYFEFRPTGLLNLTLPFREIFRAQHIIRFERRIF